jgi:hypothetical protein
MVRRHHRVKFASRAFTLHNAQFPVMGRQFVQILKCDFPCPTLCSWIQLRVLPPEITVLLRDFGWTLACFLKAVGYTGKKYGEWKSGRRPEWHLVFR